MIFDVADTRPVWGAKMPYLWELKDGQFASQDKIERSAKFCPVVGSCFKKVLLPLCWLPSIPLVPQAGILLSCLGVPFCMYGGYSVPFTNIILQKFIHHLYFR